MQAALFMVSEGRRGGVTFQRILIATDLSDAAESAARRAMALRQPRSRVRLVHVVESPGGARRSTRASAPPDSGRDELRALAERLGLPKTSAVVREGRASQEIVREAKEFGADLIVVGARGHTRLDRLLLGSRARAILRAAEASVLVSRGDLARRGKAFARVGVLTDLHPPARIAAARGRAIARETGAELLLVHAFDPSPFGSYLDLPADAEVPPPSSPGSAREVGRIVRQLVHEFNEDELDGEARELVVKGQAAHVLPRTAKKEGIDLLVVGTHGGKRLGRALLGSVAEALAERSPSSVLIAREGK